MSNALLEYLSALEIRDARERVHEEIVTAYTRLADRSAITPAYCNDRAFNELTPTSKSHLSTRTPSPNGLKGKRLSILPDAPNSSTVVQLRSELANTQRTRGELETRLGSLTAELASLKMSDVQHRQRIEQLERIKTALERRGKDRAEELIGKGRFVEEVQDEMVALNLQLNMAEQEKDRLRKENEELTRRWLQKMEEEANRMNNRMGWDEMGQRKGSKG